jgi:hypothetical protein
MNISKSENLSTQFTVTATDGTMKNVANAYATVDGGNMAINIGVTISDKTTAADPNNAAGISQQYSDFITAIRTEAFNAGLTMLAEQTATTAPAAASTNTQS